MAKRALELEILRGQRPEESFDIEADPEDTIALRAFLQDWLEANGWDPQQWGKFTLVVRRSGEMRPRKRVRL